MRLVQNLEPKDSRPRARGSIPASQRYITPADLGVPLYNESRRMELRRKHLAKYGKALVH